MHEVICLTCGVQAHDEHSACPLCGRDDVGVAEVDDRGGDLDARLVERVQDTLRAHAQLARLRAVESRTEARAQRAAAIQMRLEAQQRLLEARIRAAAPPVERLDVRLRRLELEYMLALVTQVTETASS